MYFLAYQIEFSKSQKFKKFLTPEAKDTIEKSIFPSDSSAYSYSSGCGEVLSGIPPTGFKGKSTYVTPGRC
jgi:hypothetical protein